VFKVEVAEKKFTHERLVHMQYYSTRIVAHFRYRVPPNRAFSSKRTRTAEPETVGEEEALRSALAWSRVQELRALDEDLHNLEKALLRVNVVHQRIHAQV
jgi:hypothetical protein